MSLLVQEEESANQGELKPEPDGTGQWSGAIAKYRGLYVDVEAGRLKQQLMDSWRHSWSTLYHGRIEEKHADGSLKSCAAYWLQSTILLPNQ